MRNDIKTTSTPDGISITVAYKNAHGMPYWRDPRARRISSSLERLRRLVDKGRISETEAVQFAGSSEAGVLLPRWALLERPLSLIPRASEKVLDQIFLRFILDLD